MVKKIKILVFSLLFISCNKSNDISEKTSSDSLSYYMNVVNSNNLSDQKKIIALDKSYLFINNLKNTKKNRDTLFSIMLNYYNLKQWKKYTKTADKLFKYSLSNNDSINLAKFYRYRGSYYKREELFDSSFYYYLKAEKIYLKKNDNDNYGVVLLNKGIVQYFVGDYLGSELSLSKAYYIFKESNDKNKLYGTLNQLGLVYNELKEYERAADSHLKALEIVKNYDLQSEENQEAVCYNNLGYLFLKQKKYNEAIKNFEKALNDKNIIIEDPELYSNLIDNLAYCRLKINYFSQLPGLFIEALNIRKKSNSYTEIVGSYIHLSEYYQKVNDINSAIKYSNEALRVARESKIPVNIVLALKQASIVDDKNASAYTDDYIRISDSLQIIERNSKDRFARIALETDELRKEKDGLVEQNRDILNYFMGTMAFVGVLFFMRAQRARRRELALTQAQQRANEELYKLIISQQNKLDEGKVFEKNRIAKELHDGVLGRMFGLRLNLDGLNKRTDEEAVQERLRYLEELKTIEQDLREISHELSREKFVLINNFVAIVNGLLEEQTKVNPAKLTATIGENIDWDKLSNTTKINLYRILQESLQNINKYANANIIKVDFKKDKKGNLILNIVDDGEGYDVKMKSKGIGMKNMVDRTHESDGTIEIKSEKDKGTQVLVVVPLEHKTIKV
ncbi:tetratricopeptide repeat protein [Flavobacterium sp.]|uniref:tetratricopeptide repeat-containing sensor histidine kinase n=1 Tax=Flavobacterium sp. TaxID=239 RepID=UPI0037C02CE5